MEQFWEPVIEPILARLQPRAIADIGPRSDKVSARLARYCSDNAALLHVIDPGFADAAEILGGASAHLAVHASNSLNVLSRLEALDFALIDGDHNWYTVKSELELIDRLSNATGRGFPIVLLNEVGWPYGRRDCYRDPERIPIAHRLPYKIAGLRPDDADLAEDGGLFSDRAHALYENNLRNGVLTALEDFVEAREGPLSHLIIPAFSGLAIVYDASSNFHAESLAPILNSSLGDGAARALLRTIEKDRVDTELALARARRDSDVLKARLAAEEAAAGEKTAAAKALEEALSAARKEADAQRQSKDRDRAKLARALEEGQTRAAALMETIDQRDAQLRDLSAASSAAQEESAALIAMRDQEIAALRNTCASLAEAGASRDQLDSEVLRLNGEITRLNVELNKAVSSRMRDSILNRSNLANLRADLEAYEAQVRAARSEIEASRDELKQELEAAVNAAAEQSRRDAEEIESLRMRSAALSKDLESARAEAASVADARDRAEARAAVAAEAEARAKLEVQKLDSSLVELRSVLAVRDSALLRAERASAEAESERAQFQIDLTELRAALERESGAAAQALESLGRTLEERDQTAAALSRASEELSAAQTKIVRLQLDLQSLESLRPRLHAVLQRSEAQAQHASEFVRALEAARREAGEALAKAEAAWRAQAQRIENEARAAAAEAAMRQDTLRRELQSLKRVLAKTKEDHARALAAAKTKLQDVLRERRLLLSATQKGLYGLAGKTRRAMRSVAGYWARFGGAERRDAELVRQSGLFDEPWYLRRYADVRAKQIDPIIHFLRHGAREGRDPGPCFDAKWYLAHNPDVALSRVNALVHFLRIGKGEGRATRAVDNAPQKFATAAKASIAALLPPPRMGAGIKDLAPRVRASPIFDAQWYASRYGLNAADDLALHFLEKGAQLGFDPGPHFSTRWYLARYSQVGASGVNPLVDYLATGAHSGRDPSPHFSSSFYLASNVDVASAGANPLEHYLTQGKAEGRKPKPQENAS